MVTPGDFLNRKSIAIFGALVAFLIVVILTWNLWYTVADEVDFEEKILFEYTERKESDNDAPFDVSAHDVIFEIGSGGFLILKPRKELKESAEVRIVFDDPDIIDTIGSFNIAAGSTRSIFIPLHSKHVAGHCVLTLRSKSEELKNLFKIRVYVKVVHEIFFGYLSIVLGWVYFFFWSTVYYPQIYQNWKRQSVVGLSFDYLALNLTGHICYGVFNVAMYYNSQIQKDYTKRHPKGELPVKINDVLFSVHAITMNFVLACQCFFYERGGQKVSLPVMSLVGGFWLTIIGGLFSCIMEATSWLQYLYYLSYIKVGSTPIKYTPQVYLNFIRKSTEGWSIHSVMLDCCGGIFSLMQMCTDAVNNDDWDGTLGNPGKLGLSVIAMVYDSIFMMQHFICYSTTGIIRYVEVKPIKLSERKTKVTSWPLQGLGAAILPKKKTHRILNL